MEIIMLGKNALYSQLDVVYTCQEASCFGCTKKKNAYSWKEK